MRLEETPLEGLRVVEQDRFEDDRGFFARTFDAAVFVEAGLDGRVAQCNTSFNAVAGTLRGMHYQSAPHGEAKLVRCTRGAIFDVAIDLRPSSPTYRLWYGTRLSAENGRALFIPDGFAHGFQTFEDASEVLYVMSDAYVAEAASGVRWDDPAFAVAWPDAKRTINDRDATYPLQ